MIAANKEVNYCGLEGLTSIHRTRSIHGEKALRQMERPPGRVSGGKVKEER